VEEAGGDLGLTGDVFQGRLRVALAAEDGGRRSDDLAPPAVVVNLDDSGSRYLFGVADQGDVSRAFNLIGNPNVAGAF
jgi:hypothetical protein